MITGYSVGLFLLLQLRCVSVQDELLIRHAERVHSFENTMTGKKISDKQTINAIHYDNAPPIASDNASTNVFVPEKQKQC